MPNPAARARRRVALVVVPLLLLLLLAWAPWMTPERATHRVTTTFTAAWAGVADGCSLVGEGVRTAKRTLLGYSYTMTVVYACGMLPSDAAEFQQTADVYVSPLFTVHGLPRP